MKSLSGATTKHMHLTAKGHKAFQKVILWLELWYCDDPKNVSTTPDKSWRDFQKKNPEVANLPKDLKNKLIKHYHNMFHDWAQYQLELDKKKSPKEKYMD